MRYRRIVLHVGSVACADTVTSTLGFGQKKKGGGGGAGVVSEFVAYRHDRPHSTLPSRTVFKRQVKGVH